MERNESTLSDLCPFEYQVAGHASKGASGNVGMLKHKDGFIFKPINKSPQGEVEIAFYERLNNGNDLLPLKEFVPKYFGFQNIKMNNADIRFLKLKNVTHGFLKPCVMDVKIGKQTWDPNATSEKRAAEAAKYSESKKEFGFCIPGYVVFNILSGQFDKFSKDEGKRLGKETTVNGYTFNEVIRFLLWRLYIVIIKYLFKDLLHTYVMERNESTLSDLCPFEYQVAGHASKGASGNVGMLKHKDGFIFKPINKSPQGEVEIAFYERLNNGNDLLPLKEFVPKYFGFQNIKMNNADIRFLKLKNVTHGFLKPCVMDVKIGKQTWDPNATSEKRAAEAAKYSESKKEFGFCIPGYVVFNILSGQFDKFSKDEGKRLGKETTVNAFKHFFNIQCKQSHFVVNHIVNKLSELLNWWNVQKIVHIFSSSVLLTYDASKLEELSCTSIPSSGDLNKWVGIYMIDFAHVYPAGNKKDLNYYLGLSKLIEVLKSLL